MTGEGADDLFFQFPKALDPECAEAWREFRRQARP